MAIGFGLLGVEPRAFWSLTLAELDAAIRGRLGPMNSEAPPARTDLVSLMQRFPDA